MQEKKKLDKILDKDNLSISIRRDRYKKAIRRLAENAEGRNMTENIFEAIEFYNRNQGRKDRTYREDEPKKKNWKNHLEEDQKMSKEDLRKFIEDNFSVPEGKDLSEKSKPFLQGYASIRLQEKGIKMDMEELEDVNMGYLDGLMSGANGRVDMGKLRKDSAGKSSRSDEIKDLKKKRLQIGEEQELSESLQKRVDKGEISKVEALKIQRKNVGEEVEDKSVEEIKEDRINKFQGDE